MTHPRTPDSDLQLPAALQHAFGSRLSDADSERLARQLSTALDAVQSETIPHPVQPTPHIRGARRRARLPVSRWGIGPSLRWGALGAITMAAIMMVVRQPGAEVLSFTREYVTPRGTMANLTLPDGSRAVVAPDTKIQFLALPSGERRVTLDGQAYFTVQHDPARPFLIQTGSVMTQVLGTAFEVLHDRRAHRVQLAVADGKIAFTRTSASRQAAIVLAPGMTGVITDSSATVTRQQDVDLLTAWTGGRLLFEHTPVPTLLATVGRWYDYEFRLADSTLARRHVSAELDIGKSRETLNALKDLLDVTMTFEGKVVTLRPARSGNASEKGTRSRQSPLPAKAASSLALEAVR